MGDTVLSAKNDVVFKALFVKNRKILKEFLSDILEIPLDSISDIIITNSEITPDVIDGKLSRLDINLVTSGRNINIEMQVENDDDYRERILYYWAKMYSGSLTKGSEYKDLNQTISISVFAFKMFDCEEYHSEFQVIERDRHELFSDKLSLHFFELPKISGIPDTSDRKKLWMQLIKADSEEDFDMLRETNVPIIQESVGKIYELSSDEQIKEYVRQREKARLDWNSGMRNAERRGEKIGIEKGLEKGRAEGIEQMVAGMRAAGFTEAQIEAAKKAMT